MSQININVTPQFSRDLKRLMQKKGVKQKSEAIRTAVHEYVEKLDQKETQTDFDKWRGLALKGPANPNPRFKDEDDLWK